MLYDPLPKFYYYFFAFLEPTFILIGAYFCVVTPTTYADNLLAVRDEPVTRILGSTVRGQMIIGGLGSCFFLLAMLALSMFPLIKNNLGNHPEIQGKLVRGLLIPLAIADLSHIFVTLLPLPMSLLQTPSRWTGTLHMNVSFTIFLFSVRMAYLLGIGRKPKQPKRGKSHGQVNVPLSPVLRPGATTGADLGMRIEAVEQSPAKKRGRPRKSEASS